MPNEKEKYTVSLPEDPRQRDIEKFLEARRKFGTVRGDKYGPEFNGEFVRAAGSLGWIDGLTAEDDDAVDKLVGDMRAGVVAQLAAPIGDWVNEAIDLPGE